MAGCAEGDGREAMTCPREDCGGTMLHLGDGRVLCPLCAREEARCKQEVVKLVTGAKG